MLLSNEDLSASPFNTFKEAKPKTVSNVIRSFQGTQILHPLILVVEDDADTRLMLKYLLEIWNYRVIEAVTGEEALDKATSRNPDLILMDYMLPDIDGLTTTERMRELPILAKTPIIFVSAYSEEKVRASVLAAGANDYLIKPINFGELEIALEKHLKNKSSSQNIPREAL